MGHRASGAWEQKSLLCTTSLIYGHHSHLILYLCGRKGRCSEFVAGMWGGGGGEAM